MKVSIPVWQRQRWPKMCGFASTVMSILVALSGRIMMAKTTHNCFCGREPHDLSFDCPLWLYFPAHWVKLNKRCPGLWWGVKSRRPCWAVIALSQTHTAGPCEERNEHQAHGWGARRVHGLTERAALMKPNHWDTPLLFPSVDSIYSVSWNLLMLF